jgi:hypothetical protein
LFGGFDGIDFLNDLWELEFNATNTSWKQLESHGAPSPRGGFTMNIFKYDRISNSSI